MTGEMKKVRVLLNAMHTTTGGGLTYLRGILPHLLRDERFEWVVLVPEKAGGALGDISPLVEVKVVPNLDFWRGHFWEQFCLPVLCWRWGVRAVLCNANYVPLLAPRAMPIIHTTPRAAGQAVGWRMKVYWQVLKMLTVVSLWRAPVAFSVAKHVIADYVGSFVGRKVRVAYPGVSVGEGVVERDGNLVMAVGDFYPQKDYPMIVRAFALLRERRPATRLLIVGRAVDGGIRDEVLRLVRELKIADAVTMTGAVPHATLMQTLRKATVYVNASKAECFNLPVLEALACGVPCVLPDAEFQREVAGEAAVYVPVSKGGDIAAAFAVAMFGVLESKPIAESLVRRGLQRADGFGWEKTAKILAAGVAKALRLPDEDLVTKGMV